MHFTCDGACQPNPGPAAIGVALFDDEGNVIDTISRPIGDATNNVAEAMAVIAAFQLAHDRKIPKPDVRTDSELTVKQANGIYGVTEPTLIELQKRIRRAMRVTGGTLAWIPREQNGAADALSKRPLTPSIFGAAAATIIAQIETAVATLPATETDVAAVSQLAIENIAECPEVVSDALAALRMRRGFSSTLPEESTRFYARHAHGAEAVSFMEEALAERSPATRLKALRWAARGLAPLLCLAKLRIEKSLTTPYRIKSGGS